MYLKMRGCSLFAHLMALKNEEEMNPHIQQTSSVVAGD